MKNLKLLLTIKICILLFLLSLILLPYSIKIHDMQNKYEPRRYLVNHINAEGYSFALIGDSAFCSYFVNDDNETIWKKFESITGNKCFPGALNATKTGDLINATKYISYLMPANSTVFIDIIPTRFIENDNDSINNYEQEFRNLLKEQEISIYYFFKYIKYIDLDYSGYIGKILKNIKTDRDSSWQFNRKWDTDGDFALNRYNEFKVNEIKFDIKENIKFMKEMNGILLKKNIRAVFVITPLNKKQIFTYSDKEEASRIYLKLNEIREKTKININGIHASYIDLFDSVPEHCFADLIHTNACGDKIIARSLADYASNARR